MSFPASLTTRIFKGRFVTYPDGAPAKGTVRIVLTHPMQGPTDDLIVVPFDVTLILDETGAFSILLPATDDPQWTPSKFKVTVTTGISRSRSSRITYDGVSGPKPSVINQTLQIPYNATTPIDAADVFNLPAPTPGESYIVLASKGVPGGVASLGSDGKVLPSQLPSGSGGAVAWDDVTGKPSVFPHAPVSFSDLTDKPATYPADAPAWTSITGKPSTFPAEDPAWADITSKPTTFTPEPHTHPTSQVTGLDAALTGKSNTGHGHAIFDVTGLSTALSGKSDTSHTHSYSNITDKPTNLATTEELVAGDAAVMDVATAAADAAELALTGLASKAGAAAVDAALATKFDKSGGTVSGDLGVTGYTGLHGTGITGDLTVSGQVTQGGSHITGDYVVDGYTSLQGAGIEGDLAITGSQSISGGLELAGVDVGPKLALIGAKVIVLGPADSVPGGTPAGTVIVRTAA